MIVFIIAGLILLLAGGGWFAGAVTVGWILLVAGVITTLPFIGIFLAAVVAIFRD